ncbi:MAG: hypothetical protein LBH01_11055 [Verrucomicrobiales bacterium]|nr:hypothetical protein [Verrucomicrobiales bacterium]
MKRIKLSFGAFGVSVLLHLLIFLLVGSWVIIQAVTPKVTPIGSPDANTQALTEPPPEIPEDTPDPVVDNPQPADSTLQTTPAAEMIASSVTTSNAPSVQIPSVYAMDSSAIAKPVTTSNARSDASLARKVAIGNIFGTTVESDQLGVILDVSGSGHQFLPAVVDEIEKSFKNAFIVLVFGCGMSDNVTEEQVQVLDFSKARVDPQRDAAGAKSILNQLILAQKSPETAKMIKHLKSIPNVYYLYGGDIGPTQFAFQLLLKKNVDTIYWFSDFEDQVNKGWYKKILKDVTARHVRIIAHNFSGKMGETNYGRDFVKELTEATGGKIILSVPKVK